MAYVAVLTVDNISVKRSRKVTLENVSFTLGGGQTLAVVGESGAGKSTLIAAILGLVKLSHGKISWNHAPVSSCRPALVMQEPRAAFNPVLSIRQTLLEPVVATGSTLAPGKLEQLCDQLELPLDLLDRRPGEVSIGQAQRASIIRALVSAPPLILFDEPLSALDAVTQKQTAKLIADLQTEYGFASLIVTHDLGYAAAYANEIAVLRAGCIEEVTPAAEFIAAPCTEYGCMLRDAAIDLGGIAQGGIAPGASGSVVCSR